MSERLLLYKHCKLCREFLPEDMFYKLKGTLYTYCKECTVTKSMEFYWKTKRNLTDKHRKLLNIRKNLHYLTKNNYISDDDYKFVYSYIYGKVFEEKNNSNNSAENK